MPTIAQVALSVGYSDQAHFTRAFKTLTGLTPQEFRRLEPAGRCWTRPSEDEPSATGAASPHPRRARAARAATISSALADHFVGDVAA